MYSISFFRDFSYCYVIEIWVKVVFFYRFFVHVNTFFGVNVFPGAWGFM